MRWVERWFRWVRELLRAGACRWAGCADSIQPARADAGTEPRPPRAHGRGVPPSLAGGGGAKRRRNRKTPPFCLPHLLGEVARSAGGGAPTIVLSHGHEDAG